MQLSLPAIARLDARKSVHLAVLAVLAVLLAIMPGLVLRKAWHDDPTLSHAPLVLVIALGLLWMRREELRPQEGRGRLGLWVLGISAFAHVAAVWADVEFVKCAAFFGIVLGAIGYLLGNRAFWAASGPLGFLLFTIPWPTTVVERVAFPLQITSSAYAALLAGIMGVPVHREGVHLFVMAESGFRPIYSVLVARQCSGLTSLSVLLALGYLIAYFTPSRVGWRALLIGAVVPLALLGNAVRLALILFAGAHQGAAFAQWVHDHEAPVLVTLCSFGLIGLQRALLAWLSSQAPRREPRAIATPAADG